MSRMARRLIPGHRREDRELRAQLPLDRVLALHPLARRRADTAQIVRIVQDCAQMPIHAVRRRGIEDRRLCAKNAVAAILSNRVTRRRPRAIVSSATPPNAAARNWSITAIAAL